MLHNYTYIDFIAKFLCQSVRFYLISVHLVLKNYTYSIISIVCSITIISPIVKFFNIFDEIHVNFIVVRKWVRQNPVISRVLVFLCPICKRFNTLQSLIISRFWHFSKIVACSIIIYRRGGVNNSIFHFDIPKYNLTRENIRYSGYRKFIYKGKCKLSAIMANKKDTITK